MLFTNFLLLLQIIHLYLKMMPVNTNQHQSELDAYLSENSVNDNMSYTTETDLQSVHTYQTTSTDVNYDDEYDGEYDMDVLEEAAYLLNHKVIGWSVDNSVSDLKDIHQWNKIEIIDFLDALYEEEEKRMSQENIDTGICPAEQLNAIDRLLEKYERQVEEQYGSSYLERYRPIQLNRNNGNMPDTPVRQGNQQSFLRTRPMGGSPIPNENDEPMMMQPLSLQRQLTMSYSEVREQQNRYRRPLRELNM